MENAKKFFVILGLGITIGVIVVVFLILIIRATPRSVIVGGVEFEIPTLTVFQSNPPPNSTTYSLIAPTQAFIGPPSSDKLCYGKCWEFNGQTMKWTGLTDGTEDIWQADISLSGGNPLQKIRKGYAAIITTSVPGEISACILTVNGAPVKNSCDGVLYELPAGIYQITSANTDVGGFRWCQAIGYGHRVIGGSCK